jgi:hypothetical protein
MKTERERCEELFNEMQTAVSLFGVSGTTKMFPYLKFFILKIVSLERQIDDLTRKVEGLG